MVCKLHFSKVFKTSCSAGCINLRYLQTKGTEEKAMMFSTRMAENTGIFQEHQCYNWVSKGLLGKSENIKISLKIHLMLKVYIAGSKGTTLVIFRGSIHTQS